MDPRIELTKVSYILLSRVEHIIVCFEYLLNPSRYNET